MVSFALTNLKLFLTYQTRYWLQPLSCIVLHPLSTAFIQALCIGEVLVQQSFGDPLINPPVSLQLLSSSQTFGIILVHWGYRN